ncbi:MAG: ferritin family protein [Elusimicrobia bacterium]|nr:ferritin family protein [Elusimicrobiota bacterium]
MGNLFNSSEIVKFAVQIEKNGRDFYDQAAKSVKAEGAKKIFEYLSNEEQLHIAVFETILKQMDTNEPAERYPGEYADYMLALVSENVFTKNKQGYEIARKIRNDKQALELAIGFEKDSILFYYEMKRYVWEGFHKDVDKLIVQEQEHLRKISDVLKGFNKFGVQNQADPRLGRR